MRQDKKLSQAAETPTRPGQHDTQASLLAPISSIDGPADLGERHDYYVSLRMQGRHDSPQYGAGLRDEPLAVLTWRDARG